MELVIYQKKAVTLNITNANDAPIISNPIIDVIVNENSNTVSNFNNVFEDPDDDVLLYLLGYHLVWYYLAG